VIFSELEAWQIILTPSSPLKVLAVVAAWIGSSSYYRNMSWDDTMDFFGLKIGWDLCNVSCDRDSSHDIGGLFHYFGYFFVNNSFNDHFCLNDR
jgi:hypothetical protein